MTDSLDKPVETTFFAAGQFYNAFQLTDSMDWRTGGCVGRNRKCPCDGWRDRERPALCNATNQLLLCRPAVFAFSRILPGPAFGVYRSHCCHRPAATSGLLAAGIRLESK